MEDLTALFKVRDEHHQKHTLKIFKEIIVTLECITTYLSDNNPIIAEGIMTWEDVTSIEDMLVVIGTVEYNAGTTLTFGTDEYLITDENAEEFQQVVHMSVPFNLAQKRNKDNIMEYLNTVGADKPIEEFSEVIIPLPTAFDADFDLSELSEEQIQMLKFSTPKGGQ